MSGALDGFDSPLFDVLPLDDGREFSLRKDEVEEDEGAEERAEDEEEEDEEEDEPAWTEAEAMTSAAARLKNLT